MTASKGLDPAEFGEFVERVMEDPALSRNLRLYLIALVHELRLQAIEGRSRQRSRTGQDVGRASDIWRDAAWLLDPAGTEQDAWHLAKHIIGDDAPRYEMTFPNFDARICVGTMLRPAGAPCTRKTTRSSSIPNPMTGERRYVGSCNDPRHVAAYEAQHRDGWAAWKLNGSPQPANNTGGHMMRHLVYTGWDELYSWASYRYTPGATPEPEKPRARLALVTPLHPEGDNPR